ncbi:hypothetical protein PSHT_05599 [Puccinia striiformis]|uniref:Uncharacterized protein n=2 Tax=Puccinia striiformis TaxID=27350 RepID=A0A0L0VW98_9BASI|nr:hypothetical protein H4Q26_016654 [Puccinia striiformis f. sp. tritici PST-130]KNF03290.1 hypothetical protein PSTG_03557 [Puccinia striiformis f. sp. tritici PST-78]POW18636.1 hypothetical protein PSHT_05599 [Puccinia striiformis]
MGSATSTIPSNNQHDTNTVEDFEEYLSLTKCVVNDLPPRPAGVEMDECYNLLPFMHFTDAYPELGTPHAAYASSLTNPSAVTTFPNGVCAGSIAARPVASTSTATSTSPPSSVSRSTPGSPHSTYPNNPQQGTYSYPTTP